MTQLNKKVRLPSILTSAVSGTIGSVIAEAALFPLDTIKLRVQTQSADDAIGWLGMVVKVLSDEGISGFYKGLSGSFVKETLHSMSFWLFHELLFRNFTKTGDNSKTHEMRRLLLNLLAKQLNWLCTTPFEVVASLNQLSGEGFFRTAQKLYAQDGIGTFYRGLAISLTLAINPAIMHTLVTRFIKVITAVKKRTKAGDSEEEDMTDASVVFWATGFAKIIATMVTYPLIRAKVIVQTQRPGQGLGAVLASILASEGFSGLYRGVLAMTYKTVLWNSMMMYMKHRLVPRLPTPPGTPELRHRDLTATPFFQRDPFPTDLLTADKLDEIIASLRQNPQMQRLQHLESKVHGISSDVQEIKQLLHQALAANSNGNSRQEIVSLA